MPTLTDAPPSTASLSAKVHTFAVQHVGFRASQVVDDPVVLGEIAEHMAGGADLEDATLRALHARIGDDAALQSDFVSYFWERLYSSGRLHMAGDSPLRRLIDTADLADSVYGRLGPQLPQLTFNTRREFLSLLMLKMRQRTVDQHRSLHTKRRGESRRAETTPDDLAELLSAERPTDDPVLAAIRSEEGMLSFMICSRLNDTDRRVIEAFLEDPDNGAMARRLGKTPAATRMALRRALERMATLAKRLR